MNRIITNCDHTGKQEECKKCFNCKVTYDEKKRNEVYYKTVVGKHDKLMSDFKSKKGLLTKIYNAITTPFDFLEGQQWFKIASIVVFLFLGVFMLLTKEPPWNKLNIVQGENYSTDYYAGEYLIETEEESISLKIGVTKEVKEIEISQKHNDVVENRTYTPDEDFIVNIDEDARYTLTVTYEDESSEKINFRKKQ